MDFEPAYRAVVAWAKERGIAVSEPPLPRGTAGVFYGTLFTMNPAYSAEERLYYLVHALGSVVRWSLSHAAVQAMFDELRDAKKENDVGRRERAIEAYRAFETESSEFAVWLLGELGHAAVVPSYTPFMRADLDALTEFHRTGKAPVWRDFFACWKADVAAGRREVVPYLPKPIPAFTPRRIEKQEILQEQG